MMIIVTVLLKSIDPYAYMSPGLSQWLSRSSRSITVCLDITTNHSFQRLQSFTWNTDNLHIFANAKIIIMLPSIT